MKEIKKQLKKLKKVLGKDKLRSVIPLHEFERIENSGHKCIDRNKPGEEKEILSL